MEFKELYIEKYADMDHPDLAGIKNFEVTEYQGMIAKCQRFSQEYKFSLDDILSNLLADINSALEYPVKYGYENGVLVVLISEDVEFHTAKLVRDIAFNKINQEYAVNAYLYRHEMNGCPFQIIVPQTGFNLESDLPLNKKESLRRAIDSFRSGEVRQARVNPLEIMVMSRSMRQNTPAVKNDLVSETDNSKKPSWLESLGSFFRNLFSSKK